MELAEDVDVSDATTAPGKLFEATIEYTSTPTGLVDIKWLRSKHHVGVLIIWDSALSWRSFQESLGLTRMAPLVTHHITTLTIMLSRVEISALNKVARFLRSMKITVQADLDSSARLQFERQVSATMSEVDMGSCDELASGCIERDFPVSRLHIAKEFISARTESIYVIFFYESAEDDDIERKMSELRERLDQAPVPLDIKNELSISPRMTFQGDYKPSTVEPKPVEPQVGALASALQHSIRWSALNETVEVATANPAEYKCNPTDPYFVSQVGLYKRHVAGYIALQRLGTHPDHVPVLSEP